MEPMRLRIALALALLFISAAAPAETVDVDILYPIAYVEVREDGSYAALPVGKDHGVAEGGKRNLFRLQESENRLYHTDVELISVTDSVSVVYMSHENGDTLRGSDVVDLRFRLEAPPRRQLTWELIIYGITLTDFEGVAFYDFREAMVSRSASQDSLVYHRAAKSVEEILDVAADIESLNEPIESGRYAGRTSNEVLAVTTPAMVEDFFQYMASHPVGYMGGSHLFVDLYVTWLMAGALSSPTEALEDGLAEGLDAFRARLDEYMTWIGDPRVDDTWALRFYSRVRERWTEERHAERMEILALFHALCEVADAPRWWDLYWTARADILKSNEDYEAAIEAYSEAIAAAVGDATSQAISENNLAGVYRYLERYEESSFHYEAAIRLYGAWDDPDANPDADVSWAQLARNRRELGDYPGAVEAFEISARLYGAGGDLHALEQRYHALSELGDLHEAHGRNREAIDAWQRGLVTARTLGWKATVADALDNMSAGHWNLGELDRAVELRLEAEQLHAEVGEYQDQAYTITNLAILFSILGRQEEAADYYRRAIESHASRDEWWDLGDVYYRLGGMEREQGLLDDAWAHLEEAGRIFAEHGDAADLAGVHRERAEVHEGRGNGHAADSLYTLALSEYREAEDTLEEARTQQWWGASLIRRKDHERALPKLEESLQLWKAADDLAGLSDTYSALGSLYGTIRGEREIARDYVEKALAHARAMPDRNREAKALINRADLLFIEGKMDSALVNQRGAIELYGETGNEISTLDARAGLASLHARRGEYELGMNQLGEILAEAEAGGHRSSLAGALERRCWFGSQIGLHEQARADAARAMPIFRELGLDLGEAGLLNSLAIIEKDAGNYDRSLDYFEQYRKIAEAWKDNFALSAYYNNVGEVYLTMGEFESARDHLLQCMDYGERARYHTALTASAAHLAQVYVTLGDEEEALAMARRSVLEAERAGLAPRVLDALVFQGRLLRRLGRDEEAHTLLTPLLPRARALGKQVSVAWVQTELGILAWRGGDQVAAQTALDEAVSIAREMNNPNILWVPLLHMARSQRAAGDTSTALDSYREALTSIEQVRGSMSNEKHGASLQSKHGDIYRELVDLLLELGREEEAWSVIGLMKSDELREIGNRTRRAGLDEAGRALMEEAELLLSREARLAKQLADEQAKSSELRREAFIDELKAEIKSIKKRFREFIRGLTAEHPELVGRLEIQPSNLQALQRRLGEGEAFMEPLLLPDRLVLFLVRAGTAPLVFREVPVAESRIDSLIVAMRESLARPGAAWSLERTARLATRPRKAADEPVDPAIPARDLHELLLAPLAGDLQGVTQLIVSPSGRLRYIPFGALYDGERYLIERFTLSTLTQAGAMGDHDPISAGPPLLAFGNPDGTLPGAEQEVRDLAELWSPTPTTTVFGADATMERLEDELETYRILHLATHGVLRNDRPEDSYILLAGETEAENLDLMDIVALPLEEIELAVLSACQTALGDDGTGREITSLAHTFEQTGAAAVIASLWSVSDASTSELMVDLYARLREADATRASALRGAQLEMLASERFAHPYYWAPFILIGNWH